MANPNKFTTKEVLNKVLLDSSGNAVTANSVTAQEALNTVLDTTNNRLNMSLAGGTISGDVTISGDLTVSGSNTYTYDEQIDGQLWLKDSTTSSATQGGHLRLFSDDGAAMAAGHRLGVIEFAGAEDASSTITVGAKIESLAESTFTASENGSNLLFYTTDGNASTTEKMRITSDGKVGIGGTPSYNLHITGTRAQIDGDTPVIVLKDTSAYSQNTGAQLVFQGLDSGSGTRDFSYIQGSSRGSNDGALDFFTRNSGSNPIRMRIDENGAVQIGSTDGSTPLPAAGKLAIYEAGGAYLYLQNSTTGTGSEGISLQAYQDDGYIANYSDTNGNIVFYVNNASDVAMTVKGTKDVEFASNIIVADDTSIGIADNAERIEFDGSGDISVLGANLGVGNSAPDTLVLVGNNATNTDNGIKISANGTGHPYLQFANSDSATNHISKAMIFQDTTNSWYQGNLVIAIDETSDTSTVAADDEVIRISSSTTTFSNIVDITDTTDSSDDSGDTGALRCEGGASIAKKLYVGSSTTLDNGLTVNQTTSLVYQTNEMILTRAGGHLINLVNASSTIADGGALGYFRFNGNENSSGEVVGGEINVTAEGAWTNNTDCPTKMAFRTNSGSGTQEVMRITKDKNVLFNDSIISIYSDDYVGSDYEVITMSKDTGGSGFIKVFKSGSGSYRDLEFQTGGSTRLTIASGGAVTVAGALSKGSGSFKIDHPLESKKDTHHLVHSFVEAPQADNIYRGKVNLSKGTATINIDEVAGMTDGTFVALNRDVQCFTSNESDWDAVKGSVSGNVLTISCQNENSTATISWLVVGERQDKHIIDTDWTDENGKVIVEPVKLEKKSTDHIEGEDPLDEVAKLAPDERP